ncbi:MAG: GNAT family N-acetyltransferase [Ilumatobacteraceae bacterium]
MATADDIEAMRDVERDAGRRFLGFPADTGLHEIAADDPPEAEVLAAHIDNDAAWVVTDAGEVVAYAVASMIDDDAHLDQVSVRMSHQGRGIGTILVEVVCDWASSLDFEAVSLTTFRDVPFNGPFYAARVRRGGRGPLRRRTAVVARPRALSGPRRAAADRDAPDAGVTSASRRAAGQPGTIRAI